MADIKINIITTQDGAQNIAQAADALDGLGKAGQTAGEGIDKTSQSTEKANSLFKDAADKVMAVQGALGIATQAWKMFDDTMRGGEAVQHATQALDQLSKGNAPAYITAMTASTHGLVGSMDLAHYAALGLSTGIATSADEMAKIAGIGAGLGEIFMNDATQGVAAFDNALVHVGMTRPLATLGYDITAVKDEFNSLTKQGMDKADAWKKTLLDLAPTFDDTGNAWDKMAVSMGNSADAFKDRAATGFNGVMGIMDLMINKGLTVQRVMDAIGAEVKGDAARAVADAPPMSLVGQANTRAYQADARASADAWDAAHPDQVAAWRAEWGTAGSGGGTTSPNLGYTDAEVNARISMYSYQSTQTNPLTAGEREGRRNAQGGYNVASPYEPQSDKLALSADAAQRLQAATDQAANSTRKGADAAGDFDMYLTNMEQKANRVANNLSLAQAFGTTSGGIGGEIGVGLSADVSSNRADLVKKGASKAELAQFDDQAKSALDNYKIATGQATPESIKFGDALSSVDKAARAGKISTAEAANEYLALAKAAKEGATSVGQIEALMGTMSGTGGTTTTTKTGHSMVRGQEDAGGGAGRKTGVTPFDDVKKGADDTLTKVNALASAMPDVGVQATAAAGVTVAANARITGSYIIATGAALALAAAQRLVHP